MCCVAFVCMQNPGDGSLLFGGDTTYAFLELEEETTVNCASAVQQWQTGFKGFSGRPPPFSEDEEIYKKQAVVSFLALYNTAKDAAIDCRLVTCPEGAGRSFPKASDLSQDAFSSGEGPRFGAHAVWNSGAMSPGFALPGISFPEPGAPAAGRGLPAQGNRGSFGGHPHGPPIPLVSYDGTVSQRLFPLVDMGGSNAVPGLQLALSTIKAEDKPSPKKRSALVCLTTPTVLQKGRRPFT